MHVLRRSDTSSRHSPTHTGDTKVAVVAPFFNQALSLVQLNGSNNLDTLGPGMVLVEFG